MKISEAFSEYKKYEILAMNLSNSTFESYSHAEKKIIGTLGNIEVEKITIENIHEVYLHMLDGGCCVDTARSYISKIRVVVRYCRNRGLNTIDPELIRIPRREKKVAKFLTMEEYKKFMNEISRSHRGYKGVDRMRNTLIAEMLFATGLRVGELCALNKNSIKDRQFVVVGKSKEPRVCFITDDIERKIDRYLLTRTDNNSALFVDQSGERIKPRNIQRIFRRVSKESHIYGCTPHTMRHSFATFLVEDGVDIRFVAAMLGHQSLQTTQKYTHMRNATLKNTYENTMKSSKIPSFCY